MFKTTHPSGEAEPFTFGKVQDVFDVVHHGFNMVNRSNTLSDDADPSQAPNSFHFAQRRSHQPDLDILETPHAILIEASLSDVDKSAISIEYDAKTNRVILSGEFKVRELAADTKVIRQERPHQKFERVIGLNNQVVQADQISATYADGLLVITVPKNPEAGSRRRISVL